MLAKLLILMIKLTCRVFLVLAVLGYFSGAFLPGIDSHHLEFARDIPLPLGHPTDVVASNKGDIYVALALYGRIQVYDEDGRFQFGYFVKTMARGMRLEMDKNGNLVVIPVNTEWIHVYDAKGELISSIRKTEANVEQPIRPRIKPFVDGKGRSYVITGETLNPTILRTDPKLNRTLRIQTPILLRPFAGAIPCWLTAGVAALCLYGIRKWRRRRVVANSTAQSEESSESES